MREKGISGITARSARLLRAIPMLEIPHYLQATRTSAEHLHQVKKKNKLKINFLITFNWYFWYYKFSLVSYHGTTEKVVASPSLLFPISICSCVYIPSEPSFLQV